MGKTQWVQSLASGEPVRNPGGTGTLGAIQAGALEDSNVELSDQLVNLIVAQRNYQANAKKPLKPKVPLLRRLLLTLIVFSFKHKKKRAI